MNKLYPLLIVLLVFVVSCQPDDAPMSNVPVIDLEQAGPALIKENVDSIYFVITYTDGDGDLGSGDPNVKNLFVEDTRIGLIYKYRIRDLVPGGASVGIQGELHFSIPNTVITGSGTQEQVTYSLWVIDAAGHESNRLSVGPFLVVE
ncbi:MAG: hypothetical protein ACYC1Q_06000 [Bacteroidia bacterium]